MEQVSGHEVHCDDLAGTTRNMVCGFTHFLGPPPVDIYIFLKKK